MCRRRELHELPSRGCRYGERCLVCLGRVEMGKTYRDGGYGRRAHLECAEDVAAGRKREPTPAEVRELEEAESAVSRAEGQVYLASVRASGGSTDGMRAAVDLLGIAERRVGRLKEGWAEPGSGRSK